MSTIGTPLSPAATRVMLLRSGEFGKEVIIALQHLTPTPPTTRWRIASMSWT